MATDRARAFAEDVRACGKLTSKRARDRGWHPATIQAAVSRGLVAHQRRTVGVSSYDLYIPTEA